MVENFEGINTKVSGLNNMLKITNAEMKFLEKSSGAVANNMATSGKMSGAFSGMLIPQQSIDNINKQFDDLGADAAKLLEDSLALDFDFSVLGEQFAGLTLGDVTPEKLQQMKDAMSGMDIEISEELAAMMDMLTGQSDMVPMDNYLTYSFETEEELLRFQQMIGMTGEQDFRFDDSKLTYKFRKDEAFIQMHDLLTGVTQTVGLDGMVDYHFENPEDMNRFMALMSMSGEFENADININGPNNIGMRLSPGQDMSDFMKLMEGDNQYILLYDTVESQIESINSEIKKAEELTDLRNMLKGEAGYEGIPGWIGDLEKTKMTVNHEISLANAAAAGGEAGGIDWSVVAAMAIGFGIGGCAGAAAGGVIHEGIEAHDGGVFSGPASGFPATLHGTEAVVPLPDGKSIPVSMAGGSGMVFNNTFNLGEGASRESAREISRIIQDELRRNLGGASMRGRL